MRLLIGDNLAYEQQLQDEEIQTVIGLTSDILHAAYLCAQTIGATLARRVAEGNRPGASELLKHYQDVAAQLKYQMAVGGAGLPLFAGGQSIAAKANDAQNTDLPRPYFSRDQFSEPSTDQSPAAQNPGWGSPPFY